MPSFRDIAQVVRGRETYDGAGVRLVRLFSATGNPGFDPFLMMDAFDNHNPEDYRKGFPWHPHRGIETVTYLITGRVEHGDSLGNSGTIGDGDCQWMTAGSGIIHQEMPQPPGHMLGVQLWLNLPAKDKMAPPAYGDILAAQVPVVEKDGATVRVIAGHYEGVAGAFHGRYVQPLFVDVTLPAQCTWTLATPPEHTVYTYVFSGAGRMTPAQEKPTGAKTVNLFGPGDAVQVQTSDQAMRFILLSGPPLNEPIAWGGPIVMNTQAELDLAFAELRQGTFIKS